MLGRRWSIAAAAVLGASALAPLPASSDPVVQVFNATVVTEDEVMKAQRGWCAAVLAISNAYQTGGYAAAKAKAANKMANKVKGSKAIKKSAPADGGMKEKRKNRMKPGTVTLREIKKYQKSIDMLLPRASF